MSSVAYQESPGQQITVLPVSYLNRWARSEELPGSQWLVPGRIPMGIWSHAAPAGGYKSALASQIEHHISYGVPLPGLDWEFTQRGDCLVISPDESVYEIQTRTLAILPGGMLESDGVPGYGQLQSGEECDIHYRHDPQGATMQQRAAWMIDQIEQIEAVTGRKIVWIRWDTVASLLGAAGSVDAYTHTMPLQALNAWLASSGRVLFLPNHIGKDGRSIGSVAVDANSNLKTVAEINRAGNEGTLKAEKCRGGQLWEAGLILRGALLELQDMTPQQTSHGLGTLPRLVLDWMVANGPATSSMIIEGTHIERAKCWRVILRLKAQGDIRNESGVWSLTVKGTESDRPENPSSEAHDTHGTHGAHGGQGAHDTAGPVLTWTTCAGCGSVIYPGSPCTTPACRTPVVPPAADSIEQAHTALSTARATPTETPVKSQIPPPPWRQHVKRDIAPVELPKINAASHMDGKRFVWDHSPIAAAIDMIMSDRDAGRLTPRWRAELPEDVRQLLATGTTLIDGGHSHGRLPIRREGQVTSQPPGPWVSYDVAGSFLAAYKTHVAIKELAPYEGEWTAKGGGLVLQRTPEWNDPRIGHPFGAGARPGELQLIWNPTMRLGMKLAAAGLMAAPHIEAMWLRTGYQGASEALLEGFYKRMRLARETYPKGTAEREYTKAMYSQWLSSAKEGKRNVFKREDWTGSIRAEAFGPRLWWNGWTAVGRGAELLGMGNTDELCFRPNALLDDVFPLDETRLGKMVVKDWGGEA